MKTLICLVACLALVRGQRFDSPRPHRMSPPRRMPAPVMPGRPHPGHGPGYGHDHGGPHMAGCPGLCESLHFYGDEQFPYCAHYLLGCLKDGVLDMLGIDDEMASLMDNLHGAHSFLGDVLDDISMGSMGPVPRPHPGPRPLPPPMPMPAPLPERPYPRPHETTTMPPRTTPNFRPFPEFPGSINIPVDLWRFVFHLDDGSGNREAASGRLIANHTRTNQIGTVCDDGFNQTAAEYVCREMFRDTPMNVSYETAGYGDSSFDDLPVALDDVTCPNEWRCEGTTNHNCRHHEDIKVYCTELTDRVDLFEEFEVFLADEDDPEITNVTSGRLLFRDRETGEVGTGCRHNFNQTAAEHMCDYLVGEENKQNVDWDDAIYFWSPDYRDLNISVDDIQLEGETFYAERYHACYHHQDLILRCIEPEPPKRSLDRYSVRLVNDSDPESWGNSEGFVIIKDWPNDREGPLCGELTEEAAIMIKDRTQYRYMYESSDDTEVICTQEFDVMPSHNSTLLDMPFIMRDIRCPGGDPYDCEGFINPSCEGEAMVYVICSEVPIVSEEASGEASGEMF